jgi:Tol biopolymer transport system component
VGLKTDLLPRRKPAEALILEVDRETSLDHTLGVEIGSNFRLMTASPSGTQRRRLTFGREGVRPIAWSPDGSSILFEASRGALPAFNLYVARVGDGRVLRLAAAARDGDFSPRGKQVVYSLANGGVLTVDGSRRRRLTSDGVAPRWSPDGRLIAFKLAQGSTSCVPTDRAGGRSLVRKHARPNSRP